MPLEIIRHTNEKAAKEEGTQLQAKAGGRRHQGDHTTRGILLWATWTEDTASKDDPVILQFPYRSGHSFRDLSYLSMLCSHTEDWGREGVTQQIKETRAARQVKDKSSSG